MTEQEKAELFASKAPPLNQAERDAINALFPAYIFRRSRTDEIWTTCCRKHMVVEDKDMMVTTPERNFPAVMWEPHQREQRNRWDDAPKPNVRCPLCGRMVIVKELRCSGGRDNLSRYRRAVVLRWYRGALWARAYDCAKHYSRDRGCSLTGEPKIKLVGVYRFKPGLAEATTRDWYWDQPFMSVERQDGPLTKGKWHIHGPFTANAEYGVGYDVIGLDEIQKSPFRYCMAEEAERKFTKFLHFLTACCFYPRQIEMLMKAGMSDVVMDLTERGVKHAAVIDWDEESPAKAFKLTRQEMKAFLGTNRDIQTAELYKRLKGRVPMVECAKWLSEDLNIPKTFSAAKKWSLPPEKLMRYLDGNVGCARYGGMSSLDSALRFWEDYLTAAEAMGYQLHRENVLLPRNLGTAHDNATGQHRAQLEQEQRIERERREAQRCEDQRERDRLIADTYAERKAKLEEKYGFELDGYIIRIPASGEEILNEGRKLQHCVGGYADRHIQGKTTILFMRKVKKPDEPWLTIEMNGNKLVQIHGFKNEGLHTTKGRFAPDPREVYREFLDTWLDWMEKGSRRDKKGNPKLPKKKGAAA
ncbi:MAG: hypothetical protein HFF34_10795 [Oscillospiraceae bacterium]|nr:hypothetical protein [Oscillospiraceae bacterium]